MAWPMARAEEALVAAAEGKAAAGTTPSSSVLGAQVVQTLLGLLLVIALIFALAWVARRLQHQVPSGNNNDVIQLLATRPLGPRERLLLVQVGKEQVLLGLTPGSIEALHVLQEPVQVEGKRLPGSGDFARRLKLALRPGDNNDKES